MATAVSTANGGKQPLTLDFLKMWLPILLLIIGMAVAWATMGIRIEMLQDNQREQKAQIAVLAKDMVDVKVTLARMETDLQYIRKNMETARP